MRVGKRAGWCLFFWLLIAGLSCSVFDGMRTEMFTYGANPSTRRVRVKVPADFYRVETESDSAGNRSQIYHYSNGAFLYLARVVDSARQYQHIAEERNIPLPHRKGGWIYKGLDSSGRYWREIRLQGFTFGYRNVPPSQEELFDEALNAVSLQEFPLSSF